jgi:hypothetical protein
VLVPDQLLDGLPGGQGFGAAVARDETEGVAAVGVDDGGEGGSEPLQYERQRVAQFRQPPGVGDDCSDA